MAIEGSLAATTPPKLTEVRCAEAPPPGSFMHETGFLRPPADKLDDLLFRL